MSNRTVPIALAVATACGLTVAAQRIGPPVALAGQVVDAVSGVPIAGVRLDVRGVSSRTLTVSSDGAGRFILENIPVDIYHARAAKDGYFESGFGATAPNRPVRSLRVLRDIRDVVIRMWPHALIAGAVMSADGKPIPNARVELFRYAARTPLGTPASWFYGSGQTTRTDAAGEFAFKAVEPGEYLVRVDGRSPPAPRPFHAYQMTFAPGVRRAGQGMRLRLGAGDRRRVNIRIDAVPVFPVSGRLDVPEPGQGGYVELYRADDEGDALRMTIAAGLADKEGRFLLDDVPAGAYVIEAQAGRFWTRHRITVRPAGATEVVVPLRPMLSLAGTATWDGGARPPDISELIVPFRPGPSSGPRVIVDLRPVHWAFARRNWGLPTEQRLADGRVIVDGLLPGRYLIDEDHSARWHLVSARINGIEATEAPVSVNTDVRDATFRFSSQTGRVRGRVSSATGAPDADATVVLFATDRRLWPTASASFRFARATDVSLDGEFDFYDVHPGSYFIAADGPDDKSSLTIDRLTRLAPAATRITAEVGETTVPPLRRPPLH